jgi:hypothetical protein
MVSVKALKGIGESVSLMELKGIMRLGIDVHAYDFEACPIIAHGSSPGATE